MNNEQQTPAQPAANASSAPAQRLHHRILRYRLARTGVVVAAGLTLRFSWPHLFPGGVPGLETHSRAILSVIALCLSIGLSTVLRRRFHRPHA
jgi:hypothetical protein